MTAPELRTLVESPETLRRNHERQDKPEPCASILVGQVIAPEEAQSLVRQ